MQLHVEFSLQEPLTLPIAHHHLLQSALYALLARHPALARTLHDGKQKQGQEIKPLCFSDLNGLMVVRGSRITFSDKLSLTVRSIFPNIISAMEEGLHFQGLRLGNMLLFPRQISCSQPLLDQDRVPIIMRSPLTVHITLQSGKTRYYQPLSSEFEALIQQNFARKFAFFTGQKPRENIHISVLTLSPKNKCLTFYHRQNQPRIIIEAWYGRYLLEGQPEYLTFLYYTGLGDRNAAGFGLFDLL